MSMHVDYLEQAWILHDLDARRPKQSNLRSAVSAAFLSLYHLLTNECASLLLYHRDGEELYGLLRRSMKPEDMHSACTAFIQNALPKPLQYKPAADGVSVDDLQAVAAAFYDLQEARNMAEFDHTQDFTRSTAADLITRAEQAQDSWERIKSTDNARIFLLTLLLWPRWSSA